MKYMGIPIRTKYGGIGTDASSKTGPVSFYAGAAGFESGTAFVDAAGADPTGALDSSAVVQALVDANYRRILFNPSGTYLFNTAVTVPSLPDANNLSTGREIDGQGCRIVGANSIVNCFQITDDVYPNNQRHLKFHDFVFDGTVSGAFVLHVANASWYNQYYNLKSTPGCAGTALLEIRNTSATSAPGMFSIHHIWGGHPLMDTVLLSMGGGALGAFDDFHIYEIAGGAYIEDASAVRLGVGCTLGSSSIHDIMSGGPHVVNGEGATFQWCRISRLYLEVPETTVLLPTAYANNWGVAGTFQSCDIDTVFCYFNNTHVNSPAVRAVYGNVYSTTIRNFGLYSPKDYVPGTNDGGLPYVTEYYPALEVADGRDVTWDFAERYCANGISINGRHRYLGGPRTVIANTTQGLAAMNAYDALITNFGQGLGAATITLPAAKQGMSLRFCANIPGSAWHIKPQATDRICLNGTLLDDGDKVSNASPVAGESIYLYTFVHGYTSGDDYDYDWIAVTEGGTWIDGGA